MKAMKLPFLAGFVAFAVASGAGAQETPSLTDAAAKEKERRKGAKARTYNETDLYKAGESRTDFPEAPDASPSPNASPSPAAGKREKTDGEIRAEKKADYDKRIAQEQRVIDATKKAMDTAQLELNDMSTLTVYGSRKEGLQKLLDDGLAEIKKSEAAIAAIEEEARRQGVSVSRP
jgi:hypothetical protein